MALTDKQAIDKVRELKATADSERAVLDDVRRYWTGHQALPRVIPAQASIEVRRLARMSRINIISLVVESLSQSLFVEGFRGAKEQDNSDVWSIWQANRFDARQTAIHRAALAYGTSYAIVMPGDPVPVIRGISPRRLTAVYEVDDPTWPVFALERRTGGLWRLYDATNVYWIQADKRGEMSLVQTAEHGAGITPVVRFREVEDLDLEDEPADYSYQEPLETKTDASGVTFILTAGAPASKITIGQVGALMPLQDQIDVTTFNLLVAMHFAAFKQRYIIGWVGDDEQKLAASASKLWTFDDPDTKVGDLGETALDGYTKTREASLRHAASLSQTPAHELIGELVNLSAEALAAAEAGRDRKIADRETLLGESHEQALRLAGKYAGVEVPDNAQVVWRDTSARSFAATVDALGKLSQMLGVPPQELWERIPGVSQQDVDRWKAQAAQGDAFASLTSLLARQSNPGVPAPAPAPAPGPTPAPAA